MLCDQLVVSQTLAMFSTCFLDAGCVPWAACCDTVLGSRKMICSNTLQLSNDPDRVQTHEAFQRYIHSISGGFEPCLLRCTSNLLPAADSEGCFVEASLSTYI